MVCTRIFMHAILSYPRLNLKARNFAVKSIFHFLYSQWGKWTAREIPFGTSTHKYSFSSDSELNEIHPNLRPITVQPLKHWKLFMWDKVSSLWHRAQNSKVWIFVAEPFRHLSFSKACIPSALAFSNFNFLDISQQLQGDVNKDKTTSWLFFSCHEPFLNWFVNENSITIQAKWASCLQTKLLYIVFHQYVINHRHKACNNKVSIAIRHYSNRSNT